MDSCYSSKELLLARFLTAIFSLSLSITLYLSNDVLNADGILYIYSVDALRDGGLAAFSDVYDWPFFSGLISVVSILPGVDIEFAAKSLCTVLFVLLTDALLLLSSLSASKKSHLGILVVLIISFYTVNHYRDFIIRDVGYWAASLYGLFFLVKFLDSQKIVFALLWQILTLIAFLFRIEAIVFLITIPILVAFTEKPRERLSTLVKLSFGSALIVTICAVLILLIGYQDAFRKFSEITASFDFANILQVFYQNAELISEQIMHPASDHYGPMVLASGLIFSVLWDFSTGISIPLIALLGWALLSRAKWLPPKNQYLYIALIFVNLLMLAVFALKSQLITTRYNVFALILLFLLILPTLTKFIEDEIRKPRIGPKIIFGFIIIISLSDTLITTGAKPFLKEIPEWAAQELPPQAKVMTNDFTAEYYFNKFRKGEKITLSKNLKKLNEFDFFLVHSKVSDIQLQEKLNSSRLQLIKEDGNRKNKVSLYAVR